MSILCVDKIDLKCGLLGAVEALRGDPYLFFLDSSLHGSLGRWSFAGSRPYAVVTLDSRENNHDALAAVEQLLEEHRLPSEVDAPPFACGAVGYISYDFGRYLEDIPSLATDDLHHPELCFAFYDAVLAYDHSEDVAYLCSTQPRRAKELRLRLEDAVHQTDALAEEYAPGCSIDWSGVTSNFTRSEYIHAIERVKDYIAAGDIYQVNLSQRFSAPFSGDGWDLHKALRSVNPAPFGCFLDFPGLKLAGASPERLLKLDAATRTVETRPIKGTRPRGMNEEDDARLARELAASPKERAENVMIVDMERNDLGRVCEPGSIHVPELWSIEKHPNVFQMVSTVRGKLAETKKPVDLIRTCFPGGSITGAPKIRAMQIIEEIEPCRRGIYTGSVGYIDFSGNMDLNIVIRSFLLRDGTAYFHGGGGIVADSVPELEYQETLDKVSGLVVAVETRE